MEQDMSVLHKIAFYQRERSELPNQELARQLAQTRDQADIHEIASNLWNREPNVRSDCLKVLYELGYLAPGLIAGYADDFLRLLTDRNNRLVWGAMIALSTIASLQAEKLFPHVAVIRKVMAEGSVITNDAGMKTLCRLAAHTDQYRRKLLPFLFERLAAGFILPQETGAVSQGGIGAHGQAVGAGEAGRTGTEEPPGMTAFSWWPLRTPPAMSSRSRNGMPSGSS